MTDFVFDMPTKVLFGPGQLSRLHEEKLPGTRALIVISRGNSVKKHGYLGRLENELELSGISHVLFEGVRQNPSCENVMDGAKMAREQDCDLVIALGGGSVMDCAKCIALMAVNEGHIWDYSMSAGGGKKLPKKDALPIIAITTSAGTGSEVDPDAVITNEATKEKSGVSFSSTFPSLSVVDPELMMSVPPVFTAYQGMDAFFHASESMLNKNEHVMGEMFALKAIELVARYLPRAYRDGSDAEARYYMAIANSLAGYYMKCTSPHTMEHVMGSYHEDLAHGAGLIMIAHAYYDFFAERRAAEEQMIKMAKAMGVEGASSGKDFVRALDQLIADVGCADLRMSDAGISYEELELYPPRIPEVLGGNIHADPLPLSNDDYLEIFRRSYK